MKRSVRNVIAVGLGAAVALVGAGLFMTLQPSPTPAAELTEVVSHRPSSLPARPPEGAHNVVVVIGCTLRRDQLGVYRPELDTTPYLDELAARGVVFEDMVTAAPWTRPASVALLTGHHAVSLGMVEPGPSLNKRKLHDSVLTMAEHFRANGWHTIGGTANPNVSRTWNLHQGFDRYVQPQGLWSQGGHGKLRAPLVIEALLQQVDERPSDRPLYLQTMFIETHAPRVRVPESEVRADASIPVAVHEYRAEVRNFDRVVRMLHDELRDRGLDDRNTLWVVVNDHGEGLNWPDHHGAAHGRYLAPSAVGGVWVMAGPGATGPRRSWGLASQVDVFPTLTELLGLPPVPDLEGVSQVQAMRGGPPARERAWVDTWFSKVERSASYTATVSCQEEFGRPGEDRKFRPGCFDRLADPDHANPEHMADEMLALTRWHEARVADLAAAGVERADPDAETEDQLRQLGYLD